MKSLSGDWRTALIAAAIWTTLNWSPARAAEPAPTLTDVQTFLGPVINLITWPFYLVALFWWTVREHPVAAVLVSALSAAVFAVLAMRNQARMARLRETFTTLNNDNWDEDVIKARERLREIRNELGDNPGLIAKYAAEKEQASPDLGASTRIGGLAQAPPTAQSPTFIEKKITLLTIMNDYENIALGIKHGILDERYLFQWMRATLIYDWQTLGPLVQEYRRSAKNRQIYIEFEGLASAWERNVSYRNNRTKLNKSRRRIWIS